MMRYSKPICALSNIETPIVLLQTGAALGTCTVGCDDSVFGQGQFVSGALSAFVATDPALANLNDCIITFSYEEGCSGDCHDAFTLPTQGDCEVTDEGNGNFSIICGVEDLGNATSYAVEIDCSDAKGYEPDTSPDCSLNL